MDFGSTRAAIRLGRVILGRSSEVTQQAARAASFTPYRPVDPEPGHVVTLWGVSGDGRTFLGESGRLEDIAPYSEAILWDESNGLRRLGLLPGGCFESVAYGWR